MMDGSNNLKIDYPNEFDKSSISDSIFSINFPDNPPIHDDSDNEDVAQYLNELNNILIKSTNPLSKDEINELKDLFFTVKLKNVTLELVNRFLMRITQFESLDIHGTLISILSFLSEDEEYSRAIYASQKLNSIDYSNFSGIDQEIQADLCTLIYRIISDNPAAAQQFVRSFLGYFAENFSRCRFFETYDLQRHFDLAGLFIKYSENSNQTRQLFSKLFSFVHHLSPEIQASCLKSILLGVRQFPSLLEGKEFRDSHFLDRLIFICRQQSFITEHLTFYLFQHLLKSQINFNQYYPSFFTDICGLAENYLQLENPDDRIEAISMISYAFPNHYFVESNMDNENPDLSNLIKLMDTFVRNYQSFSVKEKKEAVYAVANFCGYLEVEFVKQYFANTPNLFSILINLLTFDEPDLVTPLLTGFHRILRVSEADFFTPENRSQLQQELESLTTEDDGVAALVAQYKELSIWVE